MIATTGASITTRVSLTTTAIARAVAPAVCAVATTWPTSCTLAPVQAPNSTSVRPTARPTTGRTTIAAVPQRVTNATGVAASLPRSRVTALIAPIADAPQIEKPAASRSG